MGTVELRPMRPADGPAVLEIYQAGLDGGDASFETTAPAWPEFDAGRLPAHRWVRPTATGCSAGWP